MASLKTDNQKDKFKNKSKDKITRQDNNTSEEWRSHGDGEARVKVAARFSASQLVTWSGIPGAYIGIWEHNSQTGGKSKLSNKTIG